MQRNPILKRTLDHRWGTGRKNTSCFTNICPVSAQRSCIGAHILISFASREMTGKSALLQKTREMNRTGDKYSNKHINTPYSLPGNKGEEQKEKLPKPGSTCSLESQHLRDNKQSSHAQFEYRNPKTEKLPTAQQSTIETPKQQRYVFLSLFTQHVIEQNKHTF